MPAIFPCRTFEVLQPTAYTYVSPKDKITNYYYEHNFHWKSLVSFIYFIEKCMTI